MTTRTYIETEDVQAVSTKNLVKKVGNVERSIMSLVEKRLKRLMGLVQEKQ